MNETYYEKNLIINNRELNYQGIFIARELFSTINRLLEERGYEKREKKTEEIVTEEGRKTYLELRPFKVKSNYVTLMIKIKLTLDNVTENVTELKSAKRKFQQGRVNIVFDAWSLTDYANRWGMKPWFYFFKGFINKYLVKMKMESGFTGELTEDTAYIYAGLKKFLNSYREGGEEKKYHEEEVRRKVEEEAEKEEVEEKEFYSGKEKD